jgi:predicted transcriptional regulator
MKPGSKKSKHRLSRALLACSGVGGTLEDVASRILRDIFEKSEGEVFEVAAKLDVCERTVRRLVRALPKAGLVTYRCDRTRIHAR